MRYGTIPDGYSKSMTHLEYDEAQRLGLPALIFILDEKRQPILPVHVDIGDGAESLRELKGHLQRTHVVSFFATEEDLASKVLHDLPEVLTKLGTQIEGSLDEQKTEDQEDVLRKFVHLPKRYRGREVIIEFDNGGFSGASTNVTECLGLAIGETVSDYTKALDGQWWHFYGEKEVAEQLVDLPKMARIRARAITAYGVTAEVEWSEDGPLTKREQNTGLLIKELLSITDDDVADLDDQDHR